ncbi:hypothetical protein [Haloferula sp.]|uniref:hypothetical protein n=1 Tax=Haloferula sp. TaxID=2497595 RepID=UPI003C76D672
MKPQILHAAATLAAFTTPASRAFDSRGGRWLTAVLLACLTAIAPAQVPQLINYQGRVAVGDPPINFHGNGQFKFALVNGGTQASVQATGTATLTGMFVTGITLDDGGNGYLSTPAVTITGGGGSGATATATVSGGVVTGYTVTNAGSGYTSIPTVIVDAPPSNVEYLTRWSNDGTSTAGSEPTSAVTLPVVKGLYSVKRGSVPFFEHSPLTIRSINHLPTTRSSKGLVLSTGVGPCYWGLATGVGPCYWGRSLNFAFESGVRVRA